jgi:hypothetical protein
LWARWPISVTILAWYRKLIAHNFDGSKYRREARPHSGKYCFGKTPMQTFLDAKHLSDEKQLDRFPGDVCFPLTNPYHGCRERLGGLLRYYSRTA